MNTDNRRKDDARADSLLHWEEGCSICAGSGTAFGKRCVCAIDGPATTIVQDVVDLFRAAGFTVREEVTSDLAITGSIDSAGQLMDAVLEYFAHDLGHAKACVCSLADTGTQVHPKMALPSVVSAQTAATDLSKRMREAATAEVAYPLARLLIDGADEIDRYYGGMLAWKRTAEAKDADFSARVSGARKDAERYRFLRKGFGDFGPDVDLHNAFVDGNEKMDAAIDAAIASHSPATSSKEGGE